MQCYIEIADERERLFHLQLEWKPEFYSARCWMWSVARPEHAEFLLATRQSEYSGPSGHNDEETP